MRLFVAIELPEHVLAELHEQQQSLYALGLMKGSFVPRSHMHLTLRFLGETSDEGLSSISQALAHIAYEPFFLSLGRVGSFGDAHDSLRIIWAQLLGEGLLPLVAIIDQRLEPIIGPRTQAFVSHVTLVRVKATHRPHQVHKVLAETQLKPISFRVNAFSVLRSELLGGARIYSKVVSFDLIS